MKKILLIILVLLLTVGVIIHNLSQKEAHAQTAKVGTITGYVFYDKNENGLQDPGEGQTFDNGEKIVGRIFLNGVEYKQLEADGSFTLSNLSLINSTETAPINYQVEMVPSFDSNGQVTFLVTTAPNEFVKLPPSAPSQSVKFGVTKRFKATLPAPGTCELTPIAEHRKFPRIGDNMNALVRSNPQSGQTVEAVMNTTSRQVIGGLLSSTTISMVWATLVIAPGGYGTFNLSETGSFECNVKQNGQVIYSQKFPVTATLVSWQPLESPVITWSIGTSSVTSISPTIANTTLPSTTPQSGSCSKQSLGDINCDGKFDLLDFNIWRTSFLSSQ